MLNIYALSQWARGLWICSVIVQYGENCTKRRRNHVSTCVAICVDVQVLLATLAALIQCAHQN
jgi:hypothetical protein